MEQEAGARSTEHGAWSTELGANSHSFTVVVPQMVDLFYNENDIR